jgi:hypothetical protein
VSEFLLKVQVTNLNYKFAAINVFQYAEILLQASKEIDLQVSVDRTKYMNVTRNQNQEQSRNISTFRPIEYMCNK